MFTSEQDRVEEDSCLHPQHPLSQLEASMNRAFLPFHLTPNQPPPPNCFASAFEMRVPSPHDPQFNPVNFGMRAPQAYHPNQQVQHQYYVNSHGYPTPESSPPAENSVQWNPANQSTYVSYRQDFYSRNIAPLAYINNPELRASNCGPVLPSEKPVIKRRSNRCTCPNCSGPPQQRVGKGKAKKKHNCHFETCEKVYGKTSHLKAHIRWHNGERPFVCPYDNCVKKFTRSDELTRHVRIHTGERKFKCMHCDKGFTRSDHLKKHMKTHNRDPAEVKVRGRKKKTPNPPPSPSASLSSGGASSEASSMSPIHEEKENCENYVPQGHAFHQPGFEYFEEQRGQDLLRFGPQPQEQQFRMHLEPIPIPDIPPRQSHQQMQQHQGQMQMQLQQQEQHFNMNQYNGL